MNKEDLIFAIYKDKVVTCKSFCNMCRHEYKIDEPMKIYVRINQYQIDKYGSQLMYEQKEDKEGYKEKVYKAWMRERSRKRYYKDRRSKYENR